MIKRLDPGAEAQDAKQPKAVDGLQFDSNDDDDNFYQGTGQSVTSSAPYTTASAANTSNTATTNNTSTSININTAPAAVSPVPSAITNTTIPQPALATGSTMTAVVPQPLVQAALGTQTLGGSTGASTSMTASTEYEIAGSITNAISSSDLSAIPDIDKNITHRKMLLEEARFQLEEERERHRMKMELRKEQFREDELRREEEKSDKKEGEHWMKAYWRPAMGWLYMFICMFDFIIAPMLAMAMPLFLKYLGAATVAYTQWQSLTLSNGGLIHLAFGAILGVTAWTRGQEKIAKMG
jgi:hypothetical protein